MPRVIKPEEHQQKRGEILDAAQRLIYTKGYEQTSIQDILNELRISKGAFYHYFDSKQALLEAMIGRMMQEMEKFLLPITQDASLTALAKLEHFFDSAMRWKSARRAYLKDLLKTWYADHNAIVHQKVVLTGRKWIAPFLSTIIQQGIREGTMNPGPGLSDAAAEVVFSLMMSMSESIAMEILALPASAAEPERRACMQRIENLVLAYRSAFERILGILPGSILLFNLDLLSEWVLEPAGAPISPASVPANAGD